LEELKNIIKNNPKCVINQRRSKKCYYEKYFYQTAIPTFSAMLASYNKDNKNYIPRNKVHHIINCIHHRRGDMFSFIGRTLYSPEKTGKDSRAYAAAYPSGTGFKGEHKANPK